MPGAALFSAWQVPAGGWLSWLASEVSVLGWARPRPCKKRKLHMHVARHDVDTLDARYTQETQRAAEQPSLLGAMRQEQALEVMFAILIALPSLLGPG